MNPELTSLIDEAKVELVSACETLFDLKYDEIKQQTKAPRKQDLDSLNALGFKTI